MIIMEDSKILFWSSKFPRARGRIFSKFVEILGTRCQKCSPALPQTIRRSVSQASFDVGPFSFEGIICGSSDK